jgi:hypothetical protein
MINSSTVTIEDVEHIVKVYGGIQDIADGIMDNLFRHCINLTRQLKTADEIALKWDAANKYIDFGFIAYELYEDGPPGFVNISIEKATGYIVIDDASHVLWA